MSIDISILAVGPQADIRRFVETFSLQSGKLDPSTLRPDPLYGDEPNADFGPGKYRVEEVSFTDCFFEVRLVADQIVEPSFFYRYIREQYPLLQIICRYWQEMEGYGYIDLDGEHHYYDEGTFNSDEPPPSHPHESLHTDDEYPDDHSFASGLEDL